MVLSRENEKWHNKITWKNLLNYYEEEEKNQGRKISIHYKRYVYKENERERLFWYKLPSHIPHDHNLTQNFILPHVDVYVFIYTWHRTPEINLPRGMWPGTIHLRIVRHGTYTQHELPVWKIRFSSCHSYILYLNILISSVSCN